MRIKDIVFVGLFLFFCSSPLVLFAAGVTFGPVVDENRPKAKPPTFSASAFDQTRKQVEAYLNDHLGLRSFFLLLHNGFRFFALKTPPSFTVIPGEDGWFFYRAKRNLDATRNLTLFSDEELSKWVRALKLRSEYAATHGATFLFVVAPDPKTIFPENLPNWIPEPNARTRLDQLYEALDGTTVAYLDLRPIMRQHKQQPIYYKTDTHWADLGGYYAYRAILEKLQTLRPDLAANFIPRELSEYDTRTALFSGDLPLMMGLKGFIHEETLELVPKRPWEAQVVYDTTIDEKNMVTRNPLRPNAPNLVIFRDSFLLAVQGPLSEHFAHARFRWHYGFERRYVKNDKADVVIQFMVERVLSDLKPRAFHD